MIEMAKLNCWEVKKCGRELGGKNSASHGVCPASTESRLDGIHDGISAGRSCWVVSGTMCSGKPTGSFASKYKDCGKCEFYNTVKEEEGDELKMTIELLKIMEKNEE